MSDENPILNPDPVDPSGLHVDVPGTETPVEGGPCVKCGSSTAKDHNGFDICQLSGVPQEHCTKTPEEAQAGTS